MAYPQNMGYGNPPQHPQIANLQADAGVASTGPTQPYSHYATSPQGQPAYSPGPQSSYTPNGPSPMPSPYQQQQQQQQQPQQYGPYSTSPSQRPVYQSSGSGYFPASSQYQPQQGSYGSPGESGGNVSGNLHPARAHDRGYAARPESRQRRESQSSIASQNSHFARKSRRASQSAYRDNNPSAAASTRRASYANDARAPPPYHHRHKHDDSDDETVLSVSSDEENDDSNPHGRRHSYGGSRSAYAHESRKRRGSHRSEAEIQADKDAIDKRPTLGDSLILMYDTFKGALSGKRS